MSVHPTPFYVTGGAMSREARSYVERRADAELYNSLQQGEFCYVLTSRQMGKSSLLVRTAARLREAGVIVITLDLTMIGQNLTVEQWYYGLLGLVGQQLELRKEFREYWLENPLLGPLQRWLSALQQIVLDRYPEKVVIFVDEIDSVLSLPFRTDEFFAAIRECYNRRPEDPRLERLAYCLMGVAAPSDLIQDPRTTPFNIGRRIELGDFTEAEAAPLATGFTLSRTAEISPAHARKLLNRVLYWTSGHPFLTQRLCQAVSNAQTAGTLREVDRLCADLFLAPSAREHDDNLLFVQKRLLETSDDPGGVLCLYRNAWRRRTIWNDETDPLCLILRLSGIVRSAGRRLELRNRIYARVFDLHWIRARMPDAEFQRQRSAYRLGLLRATAGGSIALSVVTALALYSWNQTQKSRDLLARAQLERGVRALQDGNSTGFLDLIDARKTAASLPELRNSAERIWAGWYAARGHRLLQVVGHDNPVTQALFSPNGLRLATSSGGTVRLWDCQGWSQLASWQAHRTAPVTLAFSPDGDYLATWSDRELRFWKARTGEPASEPISCTPPIVTGGFAANGKAFCARSRRELTIWECPTGRPLHRIQNLTATLDPTPLNTPRSKLFADAEEAPVRLWNVLAGRPIGRALTPPSAVTCAALSGAGNWLALSTGQGLTLQSLQDPAAPSFLLPQPEQNESLVFSSDERYLAACGTRGIQLWDVKRRRTQGYPLPLTASVRQASFGPPGSNYLAVLSGGMIRFWSTTTGQPAAPPIQVGAQSFALNPSGRTIATIANGGNVYIWQVQPERPLLTLGTDSEPADFQWSANSSRLFCLTQTQLYAWNPANGRRATGNQRLEEVVLGRRVAAFSGNGQYLAFADTAATTVRVLDLITQELSPRYNCPSKIERLALSGNGTFLAATSAPDRLSLWNRRRAGPPFTTQLPITWSQRLKFSPDESALASTSKNGLELWETANLKRRHVASKPQSRYSWFDFVASTPDIVIMSPAGIEFWDTQHSQQPKRELPLTSEVFFATSSPNGKLLATATADNFLRTWDLSTRTPVHPPRELIKRVGYLVFSPTADRLAMREDPDSLQLWDPISGNKISDLLSHPETISFFRFSPDGNYLAVKGSKSLYVWRLPRPVQDVGLMERLTHTATGLRRGNSGAITAIPWKDWRSIWGSSRYAPY